MEQDPSLDPLIRRALTTPEPAADACLDPERLAAFAEGRLPPAERTTVEAHLSDCARCLSMLAAFERARPEPEPRPARGWLLAPRWLVPAATVAASVLVWFGVQEIRRSSGQPSDVPVVAQKTPDPAAAPEPPAGPPARTETDATATAVTPPAEPSTAGHRAELKAEPSANTAAAPQLQKKAEETRADAREAPQLAESAVTPAPEAARAPAPAPPPAPAAAATRERSVRGLGEPAAPDAGVRSFAFADAQAPIEILTPDTSVRFRIRGAAVERSGDGGSSWTTQPVPSKVLLAAGSCPASNVCWIVGAAGTVLRTIDGTTWSAVPPPETGPLVAVTAIDSANAVVTAGSSRTYVTTDGGRTWSVQEKPPAPFFE